MLKKVNVALIFLVASLPKFFENMNNKLINWLIFSVLSIIWGSSFILMKLGLYEDNDMSKPILTAYQVASLRIIFSAIVLLPIAIKHFKSLNSKTVFIIFLSGLQGSLVPAYLFCIAETKIDGALAGSLNALTPVFVILMGSFFFNLKVSKNKILGICVSFVGSILLFFAQPTFAQNPNIFYTFLVVLATLMYGINVNMVGKYLTNIPSLHIAAIALVLNAIPALVVLYFTGYFSQNVFTHSMLTATGFTFILGVFGTALASVIFYMLMKRAGYVFASMVTYAIPTVAVGWGIFYGEKIGWKQIVCLAIILCGVYLSLIHI